MTKAAVGLTCLVALLVACGDDGQQSDTIPTLDLPTFDVVPHDAPVPPDAGPDGPVPDTQAPDLYVPDSGVDVSPPDVGLDGQLPDVGSDAPQPDAPQPDAQQPDASQPDLAPDQLAAPDLAPDLPPAPPSPQLTAPAPGSNVFAKITVIGTGEPGATITVEILDSNFTPLGSATVTADGSGSFSVDVAYSGAIHGASLTVSVTQQTALGTSTAATVSATHHAPHTLSGNISQNGGNSTGTQVSIRIYTSSDPADLLNHVAQLTLPATDGAPLPSTPFSIALPDGNYTLRAFRDSGGPGGLSPDGQPTIWSDAQTPGTPVTISGGDGNATLVLDGRTNTGDYYDNLDARTYHEKDQPSPPSTTVGNQRVVGLGLCSGYYLQLTASRQGNPANLTPPRVRLPDGQAITLLDDGGCSDAVRDNTTSSYDHALDDGAFNYGIRDPGPAQAGDYTFFYQQTADDFIHIQTDTVASVVKLSRLREVSAPTGATPNTDLTPAITWQAVVGALFYDVDLRQNGGPYNNGADPGRVLSATTYTPATPINDDACYSVNIRAYDADPAGDIDALAEGSNNSFCTDVDGAQIISVSGAVDNRTSHNAPTFVMVLSDSSRNNRSTVRLPAGSTSYSVAVLPGDGATSGVLTAFVDADGSGWNDAGLNQALRVELGQLDLQTPVTGADLSFNPEVQLTSPAPWDTAGSLSPACSWNDYTITAGSAVPPGPFVYGVFVTLMGGGFPGTLFALPPSATSFDPGNLPPAAEHYDMTPMVSCVVGGGTFSHDAGGAPQCAGASFNTSVTTLQSGTYYTYGVNISECDWSDYLPGTPSAAFVSCLQAAITSQTGYAWSEQVPFVTP